MTSIVSVKLQKEPKLSFSNEINNLIAFDPKYVSNYLISNNLGGDLDVDYIIDEMEYIFIDESINLYSFGIKTEEIEHSIFIYATPIKEKYIKYICDSIINVSSSNILCFMNVEDFKLLFDCDILFIPETKLFTTSNKKSFQIFKDDKFGLNNNIFEPCIEKYETLDNTADNFSNKLFDPFSEKSEMLNDVEDVSVFINNKNIDMSSFKFDSLFDDDFNEDNYFSDEDLNLINDDI